MSDFLDRLGTQLAIAPDPRVTRRRRIVRRGWIAGLATFAVATPALAVVQPWTPLLGSNGNDGPLTASQAPVASDLKESLAVLRRPQTDEDRAEATAALAQLSNLNGVQTADIRVLANGSVLVPAEAPDLPPGQFYPAGGVLCLVRTDGASCVPAKSVRSRGLFSIQVSTETGTSVSGLVPDGVATVRYSPKDGAPVDARVDTNFFQVTVPQSTPTAPVPAPAELTEATGKQSLPGGVNPAAGSLEWLDANGAVISRQPIK